MPKVSVVMCVYNGEAHVREAIDSVLAQTLTDFELVVVNDGSTDSTPDILADYAARDPRIVIVHNETNLGVERSANRGLEATTGEYMARQDADDVSLPQRLAMQVQFLDAHPEVGAIASAVQLIKQQGEPMGMLSLPPDHESLKALLLINNFMHHSTLMARTAVMRSLNGYRTDLRYVEDYDLWWRLSQTSRLACLPDVLLKRRMDDGPRVSILNRDRQLHHSYQVALSAMQQIWTDSDHLLDEVAYQRWWWAGLRLVDFDSYQRCWADPNPDQQLSLTDLQALEPLWRLIANWPAAARLWGAHLRDLGYDLMRHGQTVLGLRVLWLAVHRMGATLTSRTMLKALAKPYVPDPRPLWRGGTTKTKLRSGVV